MVNNACKCSVCGSVMELEDARYCPSCGKGMCADCAVAEGFVCPGCESATNLYM